MKHWPRSQKSRSTAAFTFVEILAALLFLAILVPALIEGLTLSNRVSVIAERGAIASQLAQNKLDELTLNSAWQSGEARGEFGKEWPGYRWEASQASWELDSMTVLSLEVFFPVQGREQSVRLATLVNPATTGTTSK